MAEKTYWGDSMELSIFQIESGTSITVAELQQVEIIPSFQVFERLYSADSVKMASQKQGEFQVQVNIGISAWDVALLQQWLGGSGASSTGLVDTSDPQKFTIEGKIAPADGTATKTAAKVTGVTFDQMPVFTASRSEFVQKDLEGIGEDVTGVTGP